MSPNPCFHIPRKKNIMLYDERLILIPQHSAIPVAVRQNTRCWLSFDGTPNAFATGYDATFFGDFSNEATVLFHEASHNLEYWVLGNGSWYSGESPQACRLTRDNSENEV